MLVGARSHNYAILPPIHSTNNIYELKLFLQWNLKFFAEWRKKWGKMGEKRRESQWKAVGVRRETRKRQAMYVWRNIVTRWCNHCCHGNEAMRSVFIVEPLVVFHSERKRRGHYEAASSGRPFLPYSSVLTHVKTLWSLTTLIVVVPHRQPLNVAFYIFIQQI